MFQQLSHTLRFSDFDIYRRDRGWRGRARLRQGEAWHLSTGLASWAAPLCSADCNGAVVTNGVWSPCHGPEERAKGGQQPLDPCREGRGCGPLLETLCSARQRPEATQLSFEKTLSKIFIHLRHIPARFITMTSDELSSLEI